MCSIVNILALGTPSWKRSLINADPTSVALSERWFSSNDVESTLVWGGVYVVCQLDRMLKRVLDTGIVLLNFVPGIWVLKIQTISLSVYFVMHVWYQKYISTRRLFGGLMTIESTLNLRQRRWINVDSASVALIQCLSKVL